MLPSFVVKDVGSVTGDFLYLRKAARSLATSRQRLSTEFHGTGPARLGYGGVIQGSRWCCSLLQASPICVSRPQHLTRAETLHACRFFTVTSHALHLENLLVPVGRRRLALPPHALGATVERASRACAPIYLLFK
eukprot:scaffold16296_cov127-Isochrysis_galbana.AAC.2